ncbi:winged helix DNA-binding domain-containing protein [Micromonospora sp. LAH09]|uniref:winged helix DNA-binding domain-containing protein n=1 Tax=Micromonospora cabrerizensis TaxID=2911213 RepID=UPI001EE8C011|nr:winged helix DNA-binding domain-containing protein [Micromonospora cabrerizensis]MCG5468217.1 winged helix DNA-binding domain-containing protein [Micromonospora cabrerizensis]
MIDLSWAQVSARRLHRHALAPSTDQRADPDTDAVAGVVSTMCGAHAQVASAAELSVGLRVPGATRALVRQALWTDRTLVKSRGPRGTVHLLAAADLPMWAGALSALPVPPAESGGLLTPEQTEQVLAAIAEAVADAELTTAELTEEVVARTGPWAGERVMEAFQDTWPRWIAAMAAASRSGVICFGPNRGRATTYTSPARWLPGFVPLAGRAALADLVRRYLYAYGPATPAHFARWMAVPPGWATSLFDALDLTEVTVAGTPSWVVAGDTDFPDDQPSGVRLLPYFDAYAVGCHPRDLLFPGAAAERALARGQAGNHPVLLVDGTVAGVWHSRRSGRTIHITVEPLRALGAGRRRELAEEVERVGQILEGRATLTVGTVSVGPHA